jgi:hypothetical protein
VERKSIKTKIFVLDYIFDFKNKFREKCNRDAQERITLNFFFAKGAQMARPARSL